MKKTRFQVKDRVQMKKAAKEMFGLTGPVYGTVMKVDPVERMISVRRDGQKTNRWYITDYWRSSFKAREAAA